MLPSLLAICAGASLGALLRWLLSESLNHLFPAMPPGTLAANLIGGYLVGVAIAAFSTALTLAPEWRLLVITGFLGGLTTFSAFSAEVAALLQQGRYGWAGSTVAIHVIGSVAMTLLGFVSVAMLRKGG